MKFNACETCARIYSENNYVCFTCRDGHHHKMKGEEMKDIEIYEFFEHVMETHNLSMRIERDNVTGTTTLTFEDLDKHGFTKTFDKWFDTICHESLSRLRYRVDTYYCRFNPSLKVCKHDDHFDAMLYILDPYKAKAKYVSHRRIPEIKNVIFNDPATIVFWADGTKTVVKCQEGDIYDPEKGLAMAISRKALGDTYDYYNVFKKWLKKAEKKKDVECSESIFIRGDLAKAIERTKKAFDEFIARNCGEKVAASVKKEESTEHLRCTVCQHIRFDDDQENYYCALDGKTIDPADPACQYFDHETMTCWDCKMSECIPVDEEGSCVDLMCTTTGEKPIDRSEPACRNFVLRR